MRLRLAFLLFFLTNALLVYGDSSCSFLKIGEGARQGGLGYAFVGLGDDASTIFLNPAGLGNLKERSLLLAINELDNGISSFSFASSYPFTYHTFLGLGLKYLGVNGIEKRSKMVDEPEGKAYASDFALKVGVGKRVNEGFSYGGALGCIRERLEDYKQDTYSLDLGCLYERKKVGFGLALRNMGRGPILFGMIFFA